MDIWKGKVIASTKEELLTGIQRLSTGRPGAHRRRVHSPAPSSPYVLTLKRQSEVAGIMAGTVNNLFTVKRRDLSRYT